MERQKPILHLQGAGLIGRAEAKSVIKTTRWRDRSPTFALEALRARKECHKECPKDNPNKDNPNNKQHININNDMKDISSNNKSDALQNHPFLVTQFKGNTQTRNQPHSGHTVHIPAASQLPSRPWAGSLLCPQCTWTCPFLHSGRLPTRIVFVFGGD